MMTRRKTPEGKRVVIGTRFSEDTVAALDRSRGDTPRAVWIQELVEHRLALEAQDVFTRLEMEFKEDERRDARDLADAIGRAMERYGASSFYRELRSLVGDALSTTWKVQP
jgi:hypothetical protein